MRLRIPWLMFFVTAILILSSFALYFYVDQKMDESVELRLFNFADNLLIEIAKDPSLFKKDPASFLFSSAGNEFVSSGVLVQFLDTSGNILAKSPGLKRNSLPFTKNEDDLIKDFETADGINLKTYQRTIGLEGRKLGYLIVGVSTSQIYHTLNRLRWILAMVMFCNIIILGFGINAIVSFNNLREQKKFLSFASHELRTPLSVILGHAEIALRDAAASKNCKEALETIKEESDWMNKLVSNLLIMFRGQANTQKINKTSFNLGELAADCASSLKTMYPKKNITLILPEEAEIKADQDQIKRLINNLLENAARNTKADGEITLEISSGPKYFKIKIKDDGVGIKKELQGKIFNAFYQIEEGRGGGVGLGLAISKWIIDSHKGKITVESETGKGTTFDIMLPKD